MKQNKMKRYLPALTILIMTLVILGAIGLFSPSGILAGTGDYVTRRELAEIIAREVGEKPETISEFMFSKGLDENARMSDVIEILFQSELLKKKVNEDKTFLGKPTTKIYK